jgi:acetyl esterase/lipase
MLLELAAKSGFAVLNALEPRRRAKASRGIAYGSHPRQILDVYTPRRAKNAPVIVFFHSGGWRGGDRGSYAFVGESLAAEGFVVVVPDGRMYPEVHFPAFVEDAAAALAWARKNASGFGGDPVRLYAMGHSGGALSAALIAVDSRYLAPHGMVSRDLAGMIGLAGPYALRAAGLPRLRAAVAEAGELGRPPRLVRRAPPPLLLLHGAADDSVALDETRQFAAAARRAGGAVVLREYEGVGHSGILFALSRRFRGRAPVLDDVAVFAGAADAAPSPRFA